MSIEPGVLYIVATPIGNLGDITHRALEVLAGVARVAAEDTRHSRRLLAHYGIDKPLISLHEHNERARLQRILEALQTGEAVALISDAGTPLISDPGFPLVRAVRERGFKVVPVPGPSSLLAALCASGLPTDRFVFEGFLPAKAAARRQRLLELREESRTLVLFESSHRITATLAELASIFGNERQAVVARELTKLYEEIHGDTLGQLCTWLAADGNRQRGEFVVVVAGAPPRSDSTVPLETRRLLAALLEELSPSQAAAVAARVSGVKKKILYQLALDLQNS
ncbi:MAG TPA: 16S rRNA (cytidine(1402)-2'-O)-methyltransferase [Candidatus Competibacteraceae bacterium]|nr:16S rRNA (cytidine(1402)-2'-O)-methyltransferase [Candidatus Competibacteraceae bacterium]